MHRSFFSFLPCQSGALCGDGHRSVRLKAAKVITVAAVVAASAFGYVTVQLVLHVHARTGKHTEREAYSLGLKAFAIAHVLLVNSVSWWIAFCYNVWYTVTPEQTGRFTGYILLIAVNSAVAASVFGDYVWDGDDNIGAYVGAVWGRLCDCSRDVCVLARCSLRTFLTNTIDTNICTFLKHCS
jgi:hypothetical protein